MNMNYTGANDSATIHGKPISKQRVFTRLPFEHLVSWSYAPEEFGMATVRNVSRGGLCVTLARYLRPGRIIRLSFKDIVYQNRPIEFAARIAWCKTATQGDPMFSAGLAVEHREPVVLAELSEIFYAAVNRLREQGVYHADAALVDTMNSPSLAS